jgi:hypothetical protein
MKCEQESRILCDFGPDDQDRSIGVSSWDIAQFRHPVREVIVKRMEGRAMYDDVKRAYDQTEEEYQTYNFLTSNCKQWAAAFQQRVENL